MNWILFSCKHFIEFNTKSYNYPGFQTVALILENESVFDKAYISKKLIDCIFMVYKDIQHYCKRLNTFIITVYRYNKLFGCKLAILTKEEDY